MVGSRARRLRRQKRHQDDQAQKAQLEESTTYSELLATTIPANSKQSADKVSGILGIVHNGRWSFFPEILTVTHYQTVSYPPTSTARDVVLEKVDSDDDDELADQLKSKLRFESLNFKPYH